MPRKAKPLNSLSDEEYEYIYGKKRPVSVFIPINSPRPAAIGRSDAKKS